jgi:hypothetical protein
LHYQGKRVFLIVMKTLESCDQKCPKDSWSCKLQFQRANHLEKCNTTLKAFNDLDTILVSNVIWIKHVYWDLQASKIISKQNVLISKQDLEVLRMFPFGCNSHLDKSGILHYKNTSKKIHPMFW